MSRRLRIYIDTSVIGGYLDKEFKEASQKLINRFIKGEFQAVIIDKIRGFNAVNLKMGYSIIDIRSPWEVVSYEE